jgi:signal peptidase II
MQAEGGASLSDADVPPHRRTTALLLGVATAVILLDLASKTVIVAVMPTHGPIELLGGLVTITYTRNSGAAFSIGTNATWIFTAVAAVVTVVILRTARRLNSWAWAVCLGGLLGGALGNLLDRLFRSPGFFRGHVVDWIEWPNFPVFNLADAAIVCSVIGIVALSLLGFELDGRRQGWAARRTARSGPST